MAYTTFPFVLLELGVSRNFKFKKTVTNQFPHSFQVSIRLYLRFFMCLHFVALLSVFALPKLFRGRASGLTRKQSSMSKSSDKTLSTSAMKYDDCKEATAKPETEEEDSAIAAVGSSNIINNESEESSSGCSSFSNSMNDLNAKPHVRKTDTNYLLKDLINKEVNKIKDETDNLSNLLKEKIEAANIEGLIDMTVTGIVELKDDLMRMREPEVYGPTSESLRKRNVAVVDGESSKGKPSSDGTGSSVDNFLKKEIDAIKKEATVIPAVLSNGHAK